MRLHVVCRSHGGENAKGRPVYYSKQIALTSLVRAAERCPVGDVELIFVNDGPIPQERVAVMARTGEVIPILKGSNRGSYRWALGLARRRGWPAGDLVLFAEDDYLYRPGALVELMRAADCERDGDYFFPYSESPPQPTTGGTVWVPHPSTTSTLAVRVGTLANDERLLAICPFTGGAWDHTSCIAVCGEQPFGIRHTVLPGPGPSGASPVRRAARALALTSARTAVAVMVWERNRRHRSRRALAAIPPLATHLEIGRIAWGTDWAAVAAGTLPIAQAVPPPVTTDRD